jgi:hypothetical protein
LRSGFRIKPLLFVLATNLFVLATNRMKKRHTLRTSVFHFWHYRAIFAPDRRLTVAFSGDLIYACYMWLYMHLDDNN